MKTPFNRETMACAVCGKRLNIGTHVWSIETGRDYCREHYPADHSPKAGQ